jgi:hypothetical protein
LNAAQPLLLRCLGPGMTDRRTPTALSLLLLRAAAGDASAFRRIYDLRAPRLYAVLAAVLALEGMCHAPAEADRAPGRRALPLPAMDLVTAAGLVRWLSANTVRGSTPPLAPS